MTEMMEGEIGFVNDPGEGRKKGSVKFKDGRTVSLWPSEIDKYRGREGEEVSIPVEATDWNGKTIYHGKFPKPAGGGNGAIAARQSRASAPPPPSSSSSSSSGIGVAVAIPDAHPRIMIAIACIERGLSTDDAEAWLAWSQGQSSRKVAEVVRLEPATDAIQAAQRVDPPQLNNELDDEIPF